MYMLILVSKRKRTKRPYKRIKQNYKIAATQSLRRGFLVGLAFTIFSSISLRKDSNTPENVAAHQSQFHIYGSTLSSL